MSETEKQEALDLVRKSLKAYLIDRTYLEVPKKLSSIFHENGASFVTLNNKNNGSLRGCIGSIIAYRTLGEDLIKNTISSATGDPRFPPMTLKEIDSVDIEISILTKPYEIEYVDGLDLLSKIEQGVNGVIIKYKEKQATFLPSVWDQIDTKENFLAHLCVKAGLEADLFLREKLEVFLYQTEKIV
ncbi:MAG: AmmeMemoRadiSam system protein A [Campylobacterales bacterium]|nr:AmmeMemoRadiSam system protein A [Campylobacterales bacterium]